MQKYDFNSSSLKAKYLNQWIKDSKSYKDSAKRKIGVVLVILCFVLAVVLIILTTLTRIKTLESSFIPAEFIMPVILGLIGGLLEEKARTDAAYPYNLRENAYLQLYDDGLEYIFHEKNSNHSLYKYRITKENIHTVVYDEKHHYLTISGKYELALVSISGSERISDNPTYDDSTFAFFIICNAEEEKAIVSKIKGMADKVVDMECFMEISQIAY